MPNYTTPGSLLVKSMLPTDEAKKAFDPYQTLDKGKVTQLVNLLIKHGGEGAYDTIDKLAKLFFNKATEIGATTPLTDYINDSEERTALIEELDQRVKEVLSTNKTDKEKYDAINDIVRTLRPKIEQQNLNYLVSKGSTAAKMAKTGARGNPMQLGQGTATPMLAADVRGNPIPVVIKHSFAEGLSPAEHLAMSYSGRGNTVNTQLSTALPGALFKKLTPNVFHEVITEVDCKTTNGIMKKTDDKAAVFGRYEAPTNRFIDEHYYQELKGGKDEVKVRNPLTCEAHEGLCQHCYGIAGNGKLPDIGTNVGVIAAQSVSEVLTQAMLSTKHTGGVAGRTRSPYEDASNLLNNPSNFQDEAAIADRNGEVTDIVETSLRDYNVIINDDRKNPIFISRIHAPIVKPGDSVRVGDPLSTGTVNTRKLVDLKGLGAGRVYLADALRDVYSRVTPLDTRHFDVIARNLVKHVQIDNPGDTEFLPGQKVAISQVGRAIEESSKEVPVHEAAGKTLARAVLHYTPGTVLTQNDVDDLLMKGVRTVFTTDSGLKVTPLVPGLQTAKLLDPNWISKLSFSRLAKTIEEAAATGADAPVESTDPISSYVMGRTFGTGENGKY